MCDYGNINKAPFWRQCFVCSGTFFSWMGIGCSIGFTALFLPRLREDPHIQVDRSSESWIASIITIAVIPAYLACIPIMSNYGRRATNILSTIPQILSWALLFSSRNAETIMLSRFVQGVAIGIASAVSLPGIKEYCSSKNFDILSFVCTDLAVAFGTLIVQLLLSLMSWRMVSVLCITLPFISFVIFMLSPETPQWLASKGRFDECRRVFYSLRGTNKEKHIHELDLILVTAESDTCNKHKFDLKGYIHKFTCKDVIVVIYTISTLFFLRQVTGISVYITYCHDILSYLLNKAETDVNIMIIYMSITRLIALLLSVILIKYCKKRSLLHTCGILTMFSILGIAGSSYFRPFTIDGMTIFFNFSYNFFISATLQLLPDIYLQNKLTKDMLSYGRALGLIVSRLSEFLFLKTAPSLIDSLGYHRLFYLYSIGTSYCLIVLWFALSTPYYEMELYSEETRVDENSVIIENVCNESSCYMSKELRVLKIIKK